MRISLEPVYILHSRPYRESSLLLEALSRVHGRVGLVARGARGVRSRWKNMLQPFRPLLLSWTQRGELGTLTGADQVASPPALAGEALDSVLLMLFPPTDSGSARPRTKQPVVLSRGPSSPGLQCLLGQKTTAYGQRTPVLCNTFKATPDSPLPHRVHAAWVAGKKKRAVVFTNRPYTGFI